MIPIGSAPSGIATEELAERRKIPSRTVASYLWRMDPSRLERLKRVIRHELKQVLEHLIGKRRWDPRPFEITSRHVLFLDEAGLLDNKTFYRVLRLAEKHAFSIVGAGDVAQLQR